jgi:hypothetical protein
MLRTLMACSAATLAIVACFPQNQCQAQPGEYCASAGGTCKGHVIDATHWESGPMTGAWLDFGHAKNWLMHFRDGVTGNQLQGDIIDIQGFISPNPKPNDIDAGGTQFAPCAGNLCELKIYPDGTGWEASVINDTCADYFIYVIVTTAPVANADAGTD